MFPDYKIKKHLFGLFTTKTPKGWEDFGEMSMHG
jgi:hypothetical protein